MKTLKEYNNGVYHHIICRDTDENQYDAVSYDYHENCNNKGEDIDCDCEEEEDIEDVIHLFFGISCAMILDETLNNILI